MDHIQLPASSTTHAAALLDAWKRCDIPGLDDHLRRTMWMRTALEADMPCGESERYELLEVIAQSLRDALNRNASGPASCEVEAHLNLLRHLAKPGRCERSSPPETLRVGRFPENAHGALPPGANYGSREMPLAI